MNNWKNARANSLSPEPIGDTADPVAAWMESVGWVEHDNFWSYRADAWAKVTMSKQAAVYMYQQMLAARLDETTAIQVATDTPVFYQYDDGSRVELSVRRRQLGEQTKPNGGEDAK